MLRLNDIIDKVNGYLPLSEDDVETLNRAYIYSAKVHSGQKRSSGEPYLSHPLEVAGILSDMKLGVPTIVTGLLHDTVEDTLATLDDIESLFGPEIATLVDGVTKISKLPMTSKVAEQADNFRKLILATARDIRVVLVKLADRLHNMRTLEHLSEDRRKRIARETLDIYAPLAHRLGIYWMRTELEDIAFKYTNPDIYDELVAKIASKKKEWDKYVKETTQLISSKLAEFGIKAEITGRIKHIYSIHNKMISQGLEFDQVHDLIAFRIITASRKECYEALGAVHSSWVPVPGRFKDYIALPKGNGYQSLHTCMLGPLGERMEIQIRSRGMHEVAEYGIAAHWKYKEGKDDPGESDQIYSDLRKLLEWKDIKDPREFLDAIKGELLPDNRVYVFTPKGDLKELPKGATPLDFAYSVHSEVGNHCTRADVNGRIVTLDHRLRSGDIVKIATSSDKHPVRDWLNFVASSRAKTRIRSWLRQEEREQSLAIGKSIADKKFKHHGIDLVKMYKSGKLAKQFKKWKLTDLDDLYAAIGFGKVSVNEIVNQLLPKDESDKAPAQPLKGKAARDTESPIKSGVMVKGYDNILIRLANCCSPLPGEAIHGFITRGKGITVHRENCPELLHVDPARKIEIEWDDSVRAVRTARITVRCADTPGILSDISNSIASSDVNISKAEINSTNDSKALGTFDIAVSGLSQLEGVMKSIRKVKGVISVERVTSG